jgi:hypothetical protein
VRSTVSETLRRDAQAELLALTPAERYTLAHRLGDEDVQRHAAAHGLSIEEARRRLAATRATGRRASCAQALE